MMRISRHVLIARPPGEVFALVSDLARGQEWFAGITRWDPRSRKRRGVGAKYRVLVKVGSIEAGGTLVVTEWKPNRTIAWESTDGVDQRGRWRLVRTRSGTELSLEVEYTLPGPFGWIVERLAGRALARDMMATLLAARRILEFEEAARDDGVERARRAGVPSGR
jgi:uncharacterized membrane protein